MTNAARTRLIWKIRDPRTGLFWNGQRYTGLRFEKRGAEYESRDIAVDRFLNLGVWYLRQRIGALTKTDRKIRTGVFRHRRSFSELLDPSLDLEIVQVEITETECSSTRLTDHHALIMRLAEAAEIHGEEFEAFLRIIDHAPDPFTHVIEFARDKPVKRQDLEHTLNNIGIGRRERRVQWPLLALRGNTAAVAVRLTDLPVLKIVRLQDLKTLVEVDLG